MTLLPAMETNVTDNLECKIIRNNQIKLKWHQI